MSNAASLRKIASAIILYALLVLTALLCLGPFLWLLSSSL
jgi:putative chitobiose transport system permease protein